MNRRRASFVAGEAWCQSRGYVCVLQDAHVEGHSRWVLRYRVEGGRRGEVGLTYDAFSRVLLGVHGVPLARGADFLAPLAAGPLRTVPGEEHCAVIDLYYWTTPNGHKITISLEELGLPYRIRPVNINKGEQFDPAFLRISPNNRIPAIVDDAPADRAGPLSIFESGAILTYLAEKTGRLLPPDARGRFEVMQWLFWQVGGLGPMAGQNHHFVQYAPEKIPYAIDRYVKETARLYRVMNTRLADRPYLAGDYSIADIASYPWVVPHEKQQMNLDDFPNLKRWFATIAQRPAVERAYAVAKQVQSQPMDEAAKKVLFGHGDDGQKR